MAKFGKAGGAVSHGSRDAKHIWTVYDWRHCLAVVQRKPGALRNGAPFAEDAAPPERVAEVILSAAKDSSDRLRYAATDAVSGLWMHRLLPEWAWRKKMAKAFGLAAQV